MSRTRRHVEAETGAGWATGGPDLEALITATADLALVVDERGIITDVRHSGTDPSLADSERWRGRPLVDTVTVEARPKIEEMLQEVATSGISRQRHVNHPNAAGPDLPIAYTLVRLGPNSAVAIGRDLRVISALQQRLVEAQQALERDYWQMRHIETRYRLLFQLSEAVVVVEVGTLKVVDANPRAGLVFGIPDDRLTGWTFSNVFDKQSVVALDDYLGLVRAKGEAPVVRLQLKDRRGEVTLRGALIPQDGGSRYLIQVMTGVEAGSSSPTAGQAADIVRILDNHPDGLILADTQGRVRSANRAFLDLAQLATVDQVRGVPLSEWIGRPGADWSAIAAMIESHGAVRLFATSLRGRLGAVVEVELSMAKVVSGRETLLVGILRDVGRRLAAGPRGARDLTLAVEQLTTLVGRVSLRSLVRDTTSLVERHFLEAALELAGHNRTSAAEILGVSRQSLYVKLRRYGSAPAPGARVKPKSQQTKVIAKQRTRR